MQLQDTIRHYAWIIRYRSLFIILGTVVCATVTLVVNLSLPPVYQASTLVIVNEVTTNSNNDVFGNQALALSYSLLMTRDDVLQAVAQRIPGVSVAQLKSAVSDAPVENTQIIEIRAQAATPRRAADIANTVATIFIQIQAAKEMTDLQHVAAQLSQQITTAKENIDTAQTQLAQLLAAHASTENISQQRNQLDTYQGNYTALLTNAHQLQQRELQVSNALSIAQTATPPDKPTSPQIALNTAIAACMSLLFITTLALLFDWLDATIKTPEDVTQIARLEPLGSVPDSTPAAAPTHLPLLNNAPIEEAFVSISANFGALSKKQQRLLIVTGIHADTGTSTTAANLAIALAQSGQRVLLIDANLHHPVLHEIFHTSNARGLLNSLADGQMFWEQPIGLLWAWLKQWGTRIPNLWLLPVGSAHPSSMLRVGELRQLCASLLGLPYPGGEQARPSIVDIVIFDTPALNQGGSTLALASIADATILVVEAGKEQKEVLIKAQRMLQKSGSVAINVVINRQRPHHRPYFYVNRQQAAATYVGNAPVKITLERASSYTPNLSPETPAQLSIVPDPSLPRPSEIESILAEEPELLPEMLETPLPALMEEAPHNENAQEKQDDSALALLPRSVGMSLPGLKALSPDKTQSLGLRHYYKNHVEEK